jgi:hypothetical protein
MFAACLALKLARRCLFAWLSPFLAGLPLTPYCPNLISFVVPPSRASTAWDFVGWLGCAWAC